MFDKALRLMPEMCRLRRDIHAHPELGKQEQRTAALVEKTLSELPGISIRRCGTGVIAQLNGSRGMGPVVALRADMDALPLTEQTGLPYASQTSGVMHACGHDLHTAALLGCAMLLSQTEFFGQVRFLFQPDEEGDGGARQLIAAGAMDHVDAVFGWHTDPALAPGKIGIRYGTFYAASNPFDLTLHGKSAHIAHPEDGIDALETAARLLLRLKHLPQMLSDGADAVLAVGQLRGGTARNITAGEAFMQGVHPLADLAPRDIVTRAILAELTRSGEKNVFLDVSSMSEEFFAARFPTIYATCKRFGINVTHDSIPVRPAQHYLMGGIKTDSNGMTNIDGLYAAGECASTGVHGANRLASNSMLECLVYGRRSALHINEMQRRAEQGCPSISNLQNGRLLNLDYIFKTREHIKQTMSQKVGAIRHTAELLQAQKDFEHILDELQDAKICYADECELYNMAQNADKIVSDALARKESIGAHYLVD